MVQNGKEDARVLMYLLEQYQIETRFMKAMNM